MTETSPPWAKLKGDVLAVRPDGTSRTVTAHEAGTLRGCDIWRAEEMAQYADMFGPEYTVLRTLMRELKAVGRRYA